MTLTKSQIEDDLALAEKATPAPWKHDPNQGEGTVIAEPPAGSPLSSYLVCDAGTHEEGELIARARTALPLYAEQLMEAMRFLESRFGTVFHSGNCNFDGVDRSLCNCGVEEARDFIAAYHAQEVSK